MKATLRTRFLQKLWIFLKAVLLEKVMWANYPHQLSFKVPTVVLVVLAGCGGRRGYSNSASSAQYHFDYG